MGKIYRYSIGYDMVRGFVKTAHRLFYRKVIVTGKENIPKDKPIIFAPNHQNALMDPLALVCTLPSQIIYLARADIFKSATNRPFLRFLKIIPVYRIRDGVENLGKNEKTFRQTIEILRHNTPLCLFPEARHTDKRTLLPLKKAVPRIAFQAEESGGLGKDLVIIPVGIYYSNYQEPQSILQINYGKPLQINEFLSSYRENPQRAQLEFRDALRAKLSPLMIDIRDTEHYELYETIRRLYRTTMLKEENLLPDVWENLFRADQLTIQKLETAAKEDNSFLQLLTDKVQKYERLQHKQKIKEDALNKNLLTPAQAIFTAVGFLLTSPVIAFGWLHHALPHYLLKNHVNNKIEDSQMRSSFYFVLGMLAFSAMYVVGLLTLGRLFPGWWKVLYLIAMPLSGVFAYRLIRRWKIFRNRLRLRFGLPKEKQKLLLDSRQEIISFCQKAFPAQSQ
ncbi:1-acyl-sn-glycerol-3-phosphate acyltransferase [Prolixibacter sp. NT017]|uniref:1-acyl-sn-glycerol-3-phosphate acyltransferase n=1 Tax=Prolixibacter sp. NT017 TaxID=2652390 RepID=UPI00126DF926|nr:1-acyl-sn-glycerol-3-phosphate acyltransferase [Prolixibacter sp. NT017]GET25352.1 hypothetical protein NT017_16810 [Prolixibacter sp. NT017]